VAKPTIRYEMNIAGTNELMNGPEMVAVLRAAAEDGAVYAAGIAPRDTSEYAEAFRVETATKAGPKHDRAEARLVNDSDHATMVEFVNHGGERVLGRTVDHIERQAGRA
jgi:hypothetical protein